MKLRGFVAALLIVAACFAMPATALAAAPNPTPMPTMEPMPTVGPLATIAPTGDIELAEEEQSLIEKLLGGDNATTTNIAILLTVLSIAPSLLIMLTGFTRIIIVLSFTRNAIGTQQMPPNQALVGLALFLTLLVMSPIVDQVYQEAYVPMSNGEIDRVEAAEIAAKPLTEFMIRNTYTSDMNFFVNAAKLENLESLEDTPFRVVVPAFITSEIKRGFYIGFMIYIPFIVIDMVVASTLMSMGMMMLPPSMISLPFKVLLFILVDGWQLTVATLVQGFL